VSVVVRAGRRRDGDDRRVGPGPGRLPGQADHHALIDLPFALPTIVAGLTLLALYGPGSPFGIHLAYTRAIVFVALLFVTLRSSSARSNRLLLEVGPGGRGGRGQPRRLQRDDLQARRAPGAADRRSCRERRCPFRSLRR